MRGLAETVKTWKMLSSETVKLLLPPRQSWGISQWMGRLVQLSLLAICAGLAMTVWSEAAQNRAPAPPAGNAPAPSFEVASIKPNRSGDLRMMISYDAGKFKATGVTTKFVMARAYDVKDFQISGGPSWIDSDRYDIDAKAEDAVIEKMRKLPRDQARKQSGMMLQSLLAERFGLQVSHGTKELPVFALVVAKNGPKLHEAKAGDPYPNGIKGPDGRPAGGPGMMRMHPGQLTGQALPTAFLAEVLSQQLGRQVLDQTGLKGNYDFTLEWTPELSRPGMPLGPEGGRPGGDSAPPPDSSGPSIFTAIQEQLGLKLESTKGPVDVIVIEHIERPSEN